MKSVVSPLVQIEKKELEKLCIQVKETVATEIQFDEKKPTYGIADLWHARRTMYTAGRRWNNRPLIFSRL